MYLYIGEKFLRDSFHNFPSLIQWISHSIVNLKNINGFIATPAKNYIERLCMTFYSIPTNTYSLKSFLNSKSCVCIEALSSKSKTKSAIRSMEFQLR